MDNKDYRTFRISGGIFDSIEFKINIFELNSMQEVITTFTEKLSN